MPSDLKEALIALVGVSATLALLLHKVSADAERRARLQLIPVEVATPIPGRYVALCESDKATTQSATCKESVSALPMQANGSL